MQKNHKVLAVLACLALAAGTMAGCTTPAPPADSAPARTEEGTANSLNDGRLRYLYDLNTYREMERCESARPQGRVRGSALHFV